MQNISKVRIKAKNFMTKRNQKCAFLSQTIVNIFRAEIKNIQNKNILNNAKHTLTLDFPVTNTRISGNVIAKMIH